MCGVFSLRGSLPRLSTISYATRNFTTSSKQRATYGFIGLGGMGYPMAANLRLKISASDTLFIHDRNLEATSRFTRELGDKGKTKIIDTSRELAERSDVIITVLPEPAHVKGVFQEILTDKLEALGSGEERLFIDCSTIDVVSSKGIANAVQSAKAGRFVDAPMSGGVVGARAASLTFMLGATTKSGNLVERVKPVLLHMGKRVVHLGDQGTGLAGKLANNYLLAISNIATAEAMNLGIKLGLDPTVLGDLINTSSGRCWSSEVNNPVSGISPGAPAEQDFKGGFGIGLMKKDLRLAVEAAEEAGARLELGQKAMNIYETVQLADGREGWGRDFSVVYEWIKKQHGKP